MASLAFNVLEATPHQTVVLGSSGIIVAVNEAWREFARNNGGTAALVDGRGCDYLAVCRAARGRHSEEASFAEQAIRSILSGDRTKVQFEYPSASPSEERWFLFSAAALGGPGSGLCVSHIDVSAQKRAQQLEQRFIHSTEAQVVRRTAALAAQVNTAEERALELGRTLALYRSVQAMTRTGGWELDLSLNTFCWTYETFRIHDLWPDEFAPTLSAIVLFYEPYDRVRIRFALMRAAQFGVPFDLELRMTTAEKRTLWVRFAGNVEIDGVRPRRLYGVIEDLGGRRLGDREKNRKKSAKAPRVRSRRRVEQR